MAYYSDLFVSVCVQIFCPPVYLPDDGLPPQVVALSRQCSGPQSTVTKPRKTQPAVHRGKHLPAQREWHYACGAPAVLWPFSHQRGVITWPIFWGDPTNANVWWFWGISLGWHCNDPWNSSNSCRNAEAMIGFTLVLVQTPSPNTSIGGILLRCGWKRFNKLLIVACSEWLREKTWCHGGLQFMVPEIYIENPAVGIIMIFWLIQSLLCKWSILGNFTIVFFTIRQDTQVSFRSFHLFRWAPILSWTFVWNDVFFFEPNQNLCQLIQFVTFLSSNWRSLNPFKSVKRSY